MGSSSWGRSIAPCYARGSTRRAVALLERVDITSINSLDLTSDSRSTVWTRIHAQCELAHHLSDRQLLFLRFKRQCGL